MEATLPGTGAVQMHIKTTVDWGETWFKLAALVPVDPDLPPAEPDVPSVWMTIEGSEHRDINEMFMDVSQFIKDLESGRKSLIVDGNSQLVVMLEQVEKR